MNGYWFLSILVICASLYCIIEEYLSYRLKIDEMLHEEEMKDKENEKNN